MLYFQNCPSIEKKNILSTYMAKHRTSGVHLDATLILIIMIPIIQIIIKKKKRKKEKKQEEEKNFTTGYAICLEREFIIKRHRI